MKRLALNASSPLLPLLLLFAGAASVDADSSSRAYALYDRTIRAYAELYSYHDRGTVEIQTDDSGQPVERYEFEGVADDAGRFRFQLSGPDAVEPELVVWTTADGARRWTRGTNAVRAVPDAAMAVALSLGRPAVEAFLVPVLLAGGAELVPAVEAAALDGESRCGDANCDVLVLTTGDGGTTSRLWIDLSTALVRRVETSISGERGGDRRRIIVTHEIDAIDTKLAASVFAFEPPTTAARDGRVEDYTLSETIDVELRSLAVRAIDRQGRPIRGLQADDFELLVGKERIPVLSVDWISSRGSRLEPLASPSSRPPGPTLPRDETAGNVIVFFIQADFNSVRVKGHLRILPFVRELLDALEPDDWIAVVSFDSHLKFWQDFSRDRDLTASAVEQAIRFGAEPLVTPGPSMSLARSFPRAEAKRAANPERALRLTARSLLDIPGEKVILYLGWGLGRYGSTGFQLTPEYGRTLSTLKAARASVFVLDVTDADYHTLELGIRQVAADTGGTYAKTNRFARREVLRLTETISGYYLLTVDPSLLPEDLAKVRLRLADGRGEVLLRERQISQDGLR
jgi:hypothetical protein